MRSAFTEPAGTVSVIPPEPHRSWFRRMWAPRGARSEPDSASPLTDSLMAFVPEQTARAVPNKPFERGQSPAPSLPARSRVARPHAVTAAVVLFAAAQGVLVGSWLASRQAAPPPATGSLTITSEPASASVYVDGTRHGVTPATLSIASGQHRIEIGDGARRRTRAIEMTSGGAMFVHMELPPDVSSVAPQAVNGELKISTNPNGAQVSVDGVSRGVAPISVPNLPAGPHRVTVVGPRGAVTQQVTVQPGTVSSLMISMAGAGEFASGWLAIASPIPVQILERGHVLGSTDAPRILLPAGRHDLELLNPTLGYRARRTVQITNGGTTSLTLNVPNGMLHINALPWAEVWIGTRALGETPIANVALPLGSHELVFRHPELGEQRRTVVVGAGAAVRVGVDLRKGAQ